MDQQNAATRHQLIEAFVGVIVAPFATGAAIQSWIVAHDKALGSFGAKDISIGLFFFGLFAASVFQIRTPILVILKWCLPQQHQACPVIFQYLLFALMAVLISVLGYYVAAILIGIS